jgi:hypothetical protein
MSLMHRAVEVRRLEHGTGQHILRTCATIEVREFCRLDLPNSKCRISECTWLRTPHGEKPAVYNSLERMV